MEGNFEKVADLGSVVGLADQFTNLKLKRHTGGDAKGRPFLKLAEAFNGMTECYLSNALWDDFKSGVVPNANDLTLSLFNHKDGGQVLWLCKDNVEELESVEL